MKKWTITVTTSLVTITVRNEKSNYYSMIKVTTSITVTTLQVPRYSGPLLYSLKFKGCILNLLVQPFHQAEQAASGLATS